MHPLFANSTALTPRPDAHVLGSDRWMVWAPDATDPEKVTIGHCVPSIEQMDFAIRLGRALNKHVNEGGTWLVAWNQTDAIGRPTRLAWAWLDRDSDINFTVDCEDGIEAMQRAGIDHFVAQAQQAYDEWAAHLKEVEVAPSQMIKRRLGQAPKDPRQIVPLDFG